MDEDFEQFARYFCYTGHREGLWKKEEDRKKYMKKFYKPVADYQRKKSYAHWGMKIKDVTQDKFKFYEDEIAKWERGNRETFKTEAEVKAWKNALAETK